ncbi:hypothetical protein [Paenibacillus sp. N3.4]|nr:hypothetical protein [Paenibacillus sp. N3.4]
MNQINLYVEVNILTLDHDLGEDQQGKELLNEIHFEEQIQKRGGFIVIK